MSKNDGGPVIRVSKEEVGRPMIPRGVLILPFGPHGNPSSIYVGERITFTQTIEFEGRRFDLTYHGAEVEDVFGPEDKSFGEPGIHVFVGPDVPVTWEAK
jgi:hypothetical protein